MGDFDADTTIAGGDGRYTAELSTDWEIWGPNGGYVAAIALRAAGAESRFSRPANCAVHFLGVASFDEVQIEVEVVKQTRRAESIRALMRQGDRLIAQLICWAVADGQLDRHHVALAHDHPPWEEVPTVLERVIAAGLDPEDGPPFRFWDNFEQRPLSWVDDWDERGELEPRWASWLRYDPTPMSEDPWVEAGRILLLTDLGGWPAAHRAYARDLDDGQWIAPSLDVACHFADLATTEWLLVDHLSPAGRDGLLGATANVWSSDGRLLGSGVTQLLATSTAR